MKLITQNKKAHFNYEILDTLEVGLVLTGDEIKSVRAGKISLDEAFGRIQEGGLILFNCYIAPYTHAYTKSEDFTRRNRVLLAHKRQIMKLLGETTRKGLTLIPLKVYLNDKGRAKLLLGIAKHKKAHNKKEVLREKDIRRSAEREIKGRLR